MTDKTTWHAGAPPSIGWWPASVQHNKNVIRWWNGKHWSVGVYPKYSAEAAASSAMHKFHESDKEPVKWCARWWL